MIRVIIGVIVGFIVWSIVWAGGDKAMAALSPDWYGAKMDAAQKAIATGTPIAMDATIGLVKIVQSVIASFLAGYMCALVAGEYRRSTMALGVVLLIVGLMVEIAFWNIAPIWYHLTFLVLLIPVTILGGKLRRPA